MSLPLPRRVLASICLIVALVSDELVAQQAPYDQPPPVEPPYYRVRYEASQEPGGLIFPAAYTVWIPSQLEKLRGVIVHQHGCGEGSCLSGQTGAFDLHWQALALKHKCALLSPAYEQPEGADCQMWCDPRNGSDAAFQRALADLGAQCGHPELSTVPWALWGHSGGGHWAGGMLLLHPERVAAAWLRSGVPLLEAVEDRPIRPHDLPDAALDVPIMCNLGVNEGVASSEGRFAEVWPSNSTFFNRLRRRGALIAIAVDPLTAHECGNQRYLAIPWFDAILSARLPESDGAPLQAMPVQNAWLSSLTAGQWAITAPVQAAEFTGDLQESLWLPNESVATAWLQYVTDTEVSDTSPPPAPTDVVLKENELTWQVVADVESGLSHFIIERNGDVIATVPETPTNPFGRPLFQGLQYSDTPVKPLALMRFSIEDDQPGDANQYRVRAVNTVGLSSD